MTEIIKNIISSRELYKIDIYSITGYDDMSVLDNIKKHGCDGFIKKPVKYIEFKNVLEIFINKKIYDKDK